VHNVSDVGQIEVYMAEPLVPGPSRLEVEIAIAKLKKCNSLGSDQIPAELIQARCEMLLSATHKPINSIWNKRELPHQWNGDKTNCNNYHEMSLLSTSYRILSNILLSRISPYIDEIIGVVYMGSDVIDQLLIRFSAFVRYWNKKMGVQ
jgi:hypothetical protein